jgi:hypothetical protein
MTYEEGNNLITFDGTTYSVGDTFFLTDNAGVKKRVSVVSGSIALVFETLSPETWPQSHTLLQQSHTAVKSHLRQAAFRKLYILGGNDETPSAMQASIPFYGYDSTTGGTDVAVHTGESYRMTATLNNSGETGTLSHLALREDSGGNRALEVAQEIATDAVRIRATDDTGSRVMVVDKTGIWSDASECALYFGASKQFRFRYNNSKLRLEATATNVSSVYSEKGSWTR